MKAKEFIIENKKDRRAKKYNIKPRNPMGTAPQTGAGAHKDKKRAEKQGDVKHKGKQYDGGVAEGSLEEYGDTPKGQKMLTKVHKRAVDRMIKADDKRDAKDAKKNQQSANRAWDRFGEKEKYGESMSERIRDPEDWDEGNTEPPNNFAVYINGKKWKVFQGNGYYADDEREMRQYYKLQDWARRKSQETGKKWEVSRTGAPATESIKEDTDIPFDQCPHCSGPIFHESLMNEKQDACYHKVRSRYKVWPSAYASGALVQCRKKGAKNWGNKSK